MRVIGFTMIGVAVAVLVLARRKVVHWLRNDNRQWGYVKTIVVLIGVGFAISLAG